MKPNPLRTLLAIGIPASQMVASTPIRLHPDNPRYFLWQGRAIALITSGEHYGAVLNRDFDFHRYLATLEQDGLNYTRIFTGTYIEPPGAFGITRNTLAPTPEAVITPWIRSDVPGHADGGNKLDLDHYDPSYLERLHAFITEAEKHGVIVELTLFSSIYAAPQWAIHPLNPANNIQAYPVSDFKKLQTTENAEAIMACQEKLVRWLTRELNQHDNLFFEIQNEPWSDNTVVIETLNPLLLGKQVYPNVVEVASRESLAWQRRLAAAITDEEIRLPRRHLIAQNVSNFRAPVRDDDIAPEVSIINFHYAHPEAVRWNRGIQRVIGFDESGFCGRDDTVYRRQAWRFVLAGGGLFNSLDYSFTVGHESGDDLDNDAPGGGSPAFRAELKVLSTFLHGFELARLHPDLEVVRRSPGVVTYVLSDPGRQYAAYLEGRGPTTLRLELPKGTYSVTWIDPRDGRTLRTSSVRARTAPVELPSPGFDHEVALKVVRD